MPPTCTVPAAGAGVIEPGDRPVEGPIDLEDSGPALPRRELAPMAHVDPGPHDPNGRSRHDVEEDDSGCGEVVERGHLIVGLDAAAAVDDHLGQGICDPLRATGDQRPAVSVRGDTEEEGDPTGQGRPERGYGVGGQAGEDASRLRGGNPAARVEAGDAPLVASRMKLEGFLGIGDIGPRKSSTTSSALSISGSMIFR